MEPPQGRETRPWQADYFAFIPSGRPVLPQGKLGWNFFFLPPQALGLRWSSTRAMALMSSSPHPWATPVR